MSVGGVVLETIVLADKVWVNTAEPQYPKSHCAIYLERTDEARTIAEGDSLWWQGQWAFWTPRSLSGEPPFSDRRIRRISGSGVNRPTEEASDV